MSSDDLPPSYNSLSSEIPPPIDNSSIKGFSSNINIPDHEIVGISREYLSKRHDTFCIREGFSSFNSHVILVIDSEGKEVYTCKSKMSQVVLYDIDKTPILNAYAEIKNYNTIYIYGGKKTDSKRYAIITSNNDINDDVRIYSVEFFNQTTNKEEHLEVRYDNFTKCYGVFCNPNQPNEIMICSIIKNSNVSTHYEIELSSMVDYMLMLSLTIAFIRVESIRKFKNVTKIKGGPGLIYMYM